MLLESPPRAQRFRSGSLGTFVETVTDLVQSGGPKPEDYAILNRTIRRLGDDVRAGIVSADEVRGFVSGFTDKHFSGTLQAAARAKRHGYSGDFEVIDAIYSLKLSEDKNLRLWDLFFHSQAAPCAVRNRKAFFHQLLSGLPPCRDASRLRVLNVGCGPARDLREWFLAGPVSPIFFDCIDMDAKAIQHASNLCRPFLQHIEFYHENALRYVPSRGYDLVWSAGLFDYLSDRVFVRLLKALLSVVKPGGKLVVGNFSDFNPSRDYMEIFGDWHLEHRSREQLVALAVRAGASSEAIDVVWEPEGVNLFLQIAGS